VASAPTTWIALDGAGRLEVFIVACGAGAETNYICQLYQIAPSAGWSQWVNHGGPPPQPSNYSAAAVATDADGRLELFFNCFGALWHLWQIQTGGAWTTAWYGHGTPPGLSSTGSPSLFRSKDGRLQLFAVGSDGALWQIGQTAPNSGWSGWVSHGMPPNAGHLAGRPAVAASADGRLEVLIRGVDGALWHIWETSPNGNWSDWLSHGSPAGVQLNDLWGSPVIAANTEGRLEVFSIGSDNAVWHIWQIAPNGGWSEWKSHGTPPGIQFDNAHPALAASADGRLELFVSGADRFENRELWHIWQTSPSGDWANWYSHGHPPNASTPGSVGVWGAPAVALNSQGCLELFIACDDTQLWHIWQTAANQGWSSWLSHGQPTGYSILGQP
jgi:hypothetical protein